MAYKSLVKKEQVEAIIMTTGEKIEGKIHKLPNDRMLDMLNQSEEEFVAVSAAKVYNNNSGKLLFASDFLAVNKKHVVVLADNFSFPSDI